MFHAISISARPHAAGRKVIVETGASSASSTSEKVRFAKGDATVTEESLAQQHESVTLSVPQNAPTTAAPTPNPAPASTGSTYASLDPAQRATFRSALQELDKSARLWARNEHGQLERIHAATAKERLDGGQPVEVVTRIGHQSSNSSASAYFQHYDGHLINPADISRNSSSHSEGTVRAEYTASPLHDWESLEFFQGDNRAGVPGTPTLPASGQPVTISREFESRWDRLRTENWGIFTTNNITSSDGGYTRLREVAEN
ncbi:MAG: hypothetical protein AB7S38_15905 [Vulcanimicrobiota bacterium]